MCHYDNSVTGVKVKTSRITEMSKTNENRLLVGNMNIWQQCGIHRAEEETK
jgi:hypothetical protein